VSAAVSEESAEENMDIKDKSLGKELQGPIRKSKICILHHSLLE
jgi:hypothetical protein